MAVWMAAASSGSASLPAPSSRASKTYSSVLHTSRLTSAACWYESQQGRQLFGALRRESVRQSLLRHESARVQKIADRWRLILGRDRATRCVFALELSSHDEEDRNARAFRAVFVRKFVIARWVYRFELSLNQNGIDQASTSTRSDLDAHRDPPT